MTRCVSLAAWQRMLGAVGVVAVAGGVATAQPQTGAMRFQVSYDGSFWSSEIGVDNGFTFKVRAVAEWTDGAAHSFGFAGATFEQLDLVGGKMGDDTFDVAAAFRRQGAPETWTLQAGTGASAGWAKIDNTVPANRCNFGQLPPVLPGGILNPSFDASNPLVVFQMDCKYGFSHGDDISISGTWTRLGSPATSEFKLYTTATGTNQKPAQEAVVIPALVRYVGPSPGTAGVLLLAGALGGRRRQR